MRVQHATTLGYSNQLKQKVQQPQKRGWRGGALLGGISKSVSSSDTSSRCLRRGRGQACTRRGGTRGGEIGRARGPSQPAEPRRADA